MRRRNIHKVAFVVVLAGLGSAHAQQQGAGPSIEPRADKVLREMGRFLGKQSQFAFDATTRIVDPTAEQAEERQAHVQVDRPDKLRVDSTRNGQKRDLYYDGKTFTVTLPQSKTYAATPAPPTLDQTLEVVGQKLDVYPPGVDLLYQDPYRAITESTVSGKWLGEMKVEGVVVDRIGLTGQDVDSEIWIERGERPVPRRYVIISKELRGEPRYAVELKNWKFPKSIDAERFTFKAPKDAREVSFLRAQSEQQQRVGGKGQGERP
jgi:hypothetical protein